MINGLPPELELTEKPLRSVTKVERNERDPHTATLTLSCGHTKRVSGFPLGNPPPCFRQFCEVKGCANA